MQSRQRLAFWLKRGLNLLPPPPTKKKKNNHSGLNLTDLKTVFSKRANGKQWNKGVGRVLNGANYLKEQTQHV